jgi:hypothetical protein
VTLSELLTELERSRCPGNCKNGEGCDTSGCWNQTLNEVIRHLSDIPKWITVTERLIEERDFLANRITELEDHGLTNNEEYQ